MRYLATAFLGLSLLAFTPLHSDWNPEYCFYDEDLSVIEDPDYAVLKTRVHTALQGSWCSQEKATLLMDLTLISKPQVCVEVGAFTGSSIVPVAATLQYLKSGTVHAIDAWCNSTASKNLDDNDPNKAWWSTVDMTAVYSIFDGNMKSWNFDNVVILQNPSSEAINQIDTIDFLHLDGDYSTAGSMEDVALYIPKVRSGGYILFSNLYTMVNGKQPKLKAFCKMFESCEMVCSIERDNAVLFRKY